MPDLYQILSVARDADNQQIKTAYRRRAMETHPDRNGSDVEFNKVKEAYDILSDSLKRKEYNHKNPPSIPTRNSRKQKLRNKPFFKDEEDKLSWIHANDPNIGNWSDAPERTVDIWGEPIKQTSEFKDTYSKEYLSGDSVNIR